MTRYITPYKLNFLTGASRNKLYFEEGFVHFKSGTPTELRTPFLSKGGYNLSKYKTYVFVDKKHNTLNLRIHEVPTTFNKFLSKIGLKRFNNVKSFGLVPNLANVNKQVIDFISTDAIHKFMEHSGLRKKVAKKASKILGLFL